MPRRTEAHAPASLPSPLSTPSILRQILQQATDHTLATSMRVSHLFYEIAGPLLYQELKYPHPRFREVFLGFDVKTVERRTRSRKAVFNLKKHLLRKVKIVELGWHEDACYVNYYWSKTLGYLPRLKTLRFTFSLWCNCTFHCELCGYDREWRGGCGFLGPLRGDRIVLTTFRQFTASAVLERLTPIILDCQVLTIVISPDTLCCTQRTGQIINLYLTTLKRSVTLRIILTPWSTRVANGSDHPTFHDLFGRSRKPVDIGQIEQFAIAIASELYDTTIYMIEGVFSSIFLSHKERSAQLPDIADVERLVFASLDCKGRNSPTVCFKSRSDYLREGRTDEIDEAELGRWRKEEQKKYQAKLTRALEIEERRKWSEKTIVWRQQMEDDPDCFETHRLIAVAEALADEVGDGDNVVVLEEMLDWSAVEMVEAMDNQYKGLLEVECEDTHDIGTHEIAA